jgi:GAF domain-containing protein
LASVRKTAPRAKPRPRPSREALEAALAERERELQEALEQQTATADILKVIASSPSDVQPVFDAVADRAMRLLRCFGVVVTRYDGEQLHFGAAVGSLPDTREYVRRLFPRRQRVDDFYELCIREKRPINDPDRQICAHPASREYARVRGFHSALVVPMLVEGRVIGLLAATRQEIGAFADEDVRLLQTFADQAAIAIENTRLFNETRQALERQKVSADILSVISNSVADARPVFDEILRGIEGLFAAEAFSIYLVGEDGLLHLGAARGPNAEQLWAAGPRPIDGSATEIAFRERRVARFADVLADPDAPPGLKEIAGRIGQSFATVAAPMLWEDRGIGSIFVTRFSMAPFTDKECALLRGFADQAVIAVQNARMFRETNEALERQTATADILKVIASSPSDTQPVFEAIAASAKTLIGGFSASVFRFVGETVRLEAFTPLNPEADEALKAQFPRPLAGYPPFEQVRHGEPRQYADTESPDMPPSLRDVGRTRGFRAIIHMPLMSNGTPIGDVSVTRETPGPFSTHHVALLRTFADQAVIAIENTRLFNETQKALERQTATADILKVIASSPSDVQPVFEAIAASANKLIGGYATGVFRILGDALHLVAFTPTTPMADKALEASFPRPLAEFPPLDRLRLGEFVQFADTEAEDVPPVNRQLARVRGYRAMLHVPLMSKDAPIGLISVTRASPGPFSAHHVELLRTFADQAVIAINNVDLFNETQEALQQQTATAEVLKVISRSVFDLDSVLQTLIDVAVRLTRGSRGTIFIREGDFLIARAFHHNVPPTLREYLAGERWRVDGDSHMAAAVRQGAVVHVADLSKSQTESDRETSKRAAFGAGLWAPLMRDGEAIGVFGVPREEPIAFTEREIDLVRTFADQAVIAIENARLFEQVQARTRDLTEALQQQTATADVLKVISRSAFDLQAVFDTLISSAVRLIGGIHGTICLRDGDVYRYRAHFGLTPQFANWLDEHPAKPGRGSSVGRVTLSGMVESIVDVLDDPEYVVPANDYNRIRSMLAAPLLRNDKVEGVLVIARPEPGSFTQRQIEIVQTFADQAVIAIENARLFDEVQARTRDLSEALQQQTATAEVLKVISRSAFDLQTVLDTLMASAARLCGGDAGAIYLQSGDAFYAKSVMAPHAEPEFLRLLETRPQRPGRGSAGARVLLTGEVQNIPDLQADPEWDPDLKATEPHRALLGVPMKRDGSIFGAIVIARAATGAYSQRQIELAQTFADQAVIAIQNARLFDEVQARTRDLTEALGRQTASAEILRVIASSPTDVQPVFDAIARSAAELCEGARGGVLQMRNGLIHFVGAYNSATASADRAGGARAYPAPPHRGTIAGRAILDRAVAHVPDLAADPEYAATGFVEMGFRSALSAPMLRKGEPIGAINVIREQARPFSESQIELLKIFADQAVIAINNVGLFKETQEALKQQTATADVLKVISRSAFDLQVVLRTLVESAARLCDAERATITRQIDGVFYRTESYGFSDDFMDYVRGVPVVPDRGSASGRALLEGRVIHIADVGADPEYTFNEAQRLGDFRTILGVPMLREGVAVGVMSIARSEARPFTDRQIELVTTFADQAAIAIENARLFDEVRARTRDLSEALQQQTATADVLKVISRSAFDLQTVLDTLVESAYKLCGAAYGLIYLRTDEAFECKAIGGVGLEEGSRLFMGRPIRAGRSTVAERVIATGEITSIPDLRADPEFDPKIKAAISSSGDIRGFSTLRSLVGVPMKRDDVVVGVLVIARSQTGSLPGRQLELLRTFADQAVIAIENARLFEEVQARTRDLTEALQQQIATADVLKAISRSAFDLKPVFDTLVASAVQLSDAFSGAICVRDGEVFRYQAFAGPGASPELHDYLLAHPATPGRGSIAGRAVLSGQVEQIPDIREDPEYAVPLDARGNRARAVLGVPLLGKERVEGAIVLTRQEPGLYPQRQIEILQTFADQAVIAIENVRLFEEVQARTRDLQESLQQQTATADVLKAISRTAFDLDTVLETLISTAVRLCNATHGVIFRRHGEVYKYGASRMEVDPVYHDHERNVEIRPGRGTLVGRVALEKRVVRIDDAWSDPEYDEKEEARVGKVRAMLGVPLLRGGEPIGAFALARGEPIPFTQRQVELVATFADQAVIAIENSRLFEQVQARTRDLSEALQQQTATADVLNVISRSAFDLQPVFNTMAENAVRLCEAERAVIFKFDGELLRAVAAHNVSPELWQFLDRNPIAPGRRTISARAALYRRTVQVADVQSDPDYTYAVRDVDLIRATAAIPMLKGDQLVGTITIYKLEVKPFTDKQIKLVETFAEQAVIAIENVRLFEELQARTRDLEEALQQQTATADVLRAISRTAFDLDTVLETLIATAVRLCNANHGEIFRRHDDVYRYAASWRLDSKYLAHEKLTEIRPGRKTLIGRVALENRAVRIDDAWSDAEYGEKNEARVGNVRAMLGVPLLRGGEPIGAFALGRGEPTPFTERQLELVTTFADQAVIAIENVRLFDQVQTRTKELAASLDNLQKAQDRLIQSEKLASLGQLTAGIAHEIKNPLNFVNNFSALSRELLGELGDVLKRAPLEESTREEADELIGMVSGNLEKVAQHGKRADSIVKNMLLHSREGSGERASANVNAMVEEALNLAYHGARAEKPGFNVTIAKSLDPAAGVADIYPQEMTRVLLNLISNGFYATNKRRQGEASGSYEPTLAASTRDLGTSVEIAIRDNGTGIPEEVKAKMFNPFFTTKPAGEGTGLGLSLSHDIVVKQHGGTLDVESELGAFTRFTITLPRATGGRDAS